MQLRALCPALWLSLLVAAPAAARDRALFLPAQSAATPDGALALSSNPAGLSTVNGWDLRLQFSADGAATANRGAGWGLFAATPPLGPVSLGVAAEHDADPVGGLGLGGGIRPVWYATQRISGGAAVKLGERLALGAAMHWVANNGVTLDRSMQFGALFRPWSWLSVAARAGELGSVRFGFAQSHFGVGVAVRPWFGTDRVTLAGDVDWRVGGSRQETGLTAWLRAAQGWSVGLDARSYTPADPLLPAEERALLMLRLSFGRVGLEGGIHTDGRDPAQRGMTLGVRLSSDQLPSLREHGPPVANLLIKGALKEQADEPGTHFAALLLDLEWLATQRATEVIVLRASELEANWAQVEELRAAIAHLRQAGKKVVYFSDTLATRGLALAAACDRIVLPPAGMVTARGIATDFIGLRESLERIGVAVETVRFAEHKTAPEALTNDAPSEALKQQMTHAVVRRWEDFTAAVALGRGLTPTGVEDVLRAGAAFPEDALAARLIDAVAAEADLGKLIHGWKWTDSDQLPGEFHRPSERARRWGPLPKLAVVEISGSIADHQGGTGLLGKSIGGTDMAEVIHRTSRLPGVRALVARIDSPGGGILGSEAMRDALARASERVPVFGSMGGVAASGGYWTSLGASTVFADRATVTGSIGAFLLKPNLAGLWQKIGLHLTSASAGPWAEIATIHRPWSPAELATARLQLGKYYALFLNLVATRRHLSLATVEGLGGGRIWFGDEALGHRLVDKSGGLLDARRAARQSAELEPDDEVQVVFAPRLGLLERARQKLLGVLADGPPPAGSALLAALRAAAGPWLDAAALAELSSGPLALLPTLPDATGP